MASGSVDDGVGTTTSKQVRVLCKESKCGAEKEKLPSIPAEGIENLGNFKLENLNYKPFHAKQVAVAVIW